MSSQFVQQISVDGLHLPKELMQQWGAREGQEVVVQCERDAIRIVPTEVDASRIMDIAATYVLDNVGDATAVGQPQRVADRWQIPIVLSYQGKQVGVLTYSLRGELMPDQSDSPQRMRERSRED